MPPYKGEPMYTKSHLSCQWVMAIFVFFSALTFIFSPDGIASVFIDTDQDHIPDSWEIAHGLNPDDSTDADRDPDNDRLTNRDEFYAGTDPQNYTPVSSMADKQILDLFKGKSFLYFWDAALPGYYFSADHGNFNDPGQFADVVSNAITGFALMGYVIADYNNWVRHDEAYERIRSVLARAVELQKPEYDKLGVPAAEQGNRHGYLYHWQSKDGTKSPGGSEISTIDHALFVAGALVAGEYYKGTEVEDLARQLYLNTDWNWLYDGQVLYQGWAEDPNGSFDGGTTLDSWNRYSELLILLFLAMGNDDPGPRGAAICFPMNTRIYSPATLRKIFPLYLICPIP